MHIVVAKVLTVGLLLLSPLGALAQQVVECDVLPMRSNGVTRLPPVVFDSYGLPAAPAYQVAPCVALRETHGGVGRPAPNRVGRPAPNRSGAVYAGFDGPEVVSPRYGGTDVPEAVASPYIPDVPSVLVEPDDALGWSGHCGSFRAEFRSLKTRICADHCNYYSWPTMRDMALGFGLGAIVANTSLDQGFQDWYQDDVRSDDTDDAAVFCKTFGEGRIFIPAFAGLGLLNLFCRDVPVLGIAGDFGDRATRAFLVGAPPMLLMQYVTGASRPGESGVESQWKPLDDNNGVSGHSFMGAVPFITGAMMTDNLVLKGGFYILSTFAAWSRVNDDRHYLSQACLGWWMAYLACRSVCQTNFEEKSVVFTPIAGPRTVGVGVVLRW